MKSFLKTVAEIYYNAHDIGIERVLFIFPNRRAGLFFQKEYLTLAKADNKNSFAPQTTDINSFAQSITGLKRAGEIELITKLYNCYKPHIPQASTSPHTLDSFIGTALTIISDFNEIDKYLVDPQKLYRNLEDLKSIDAGLQFLNDTQREAIRNFFGIAIPEEEDDFRLYNKTFISFWNILLNLYTDFTTALLADGRAYDGLIFRQAIEQNKISAANKKLKHDRYVFIGFNMLTTSEERLMELIKNERQADFYFDYPDFYATSDLKQSVAVNYKNNLKKFPSLYSFEQNHETPSPEVALYGIPSLSNQPQIVQKLLTDANDPNISDNTCVVVPDESIAESLLYRIPEKIKQVNLSMGLPLINSAIASLILNIVNLYATYSRGFSYTSMINILSHPSVLKYNEELATKLSRTITRDRHAIVTTPITDLLARVQYSGNDKLFVDIFTPKQSTEDVIIALLDFLEQIYDYDASPHILALPDAMNREYAQRLMKIIQSVYNTLKDNNISLAGEHCDLSVRTFGIYLHRLAANLKIQLDGEPVAGLQVLGMLESRLLDFDNIIITSFNDAAIPGTVHTDSLIPYNLRAAYNLPTYKTQEAIYLYNFYRLIHRAKKLYLIYDSRANNGGKKNEISRLYYQFLYLLPDFKITQYLVNPSINGITFDKKIVLEHNDTIKSLIDRYRDDTKPRNYISASSLKTYMNCPLQFAFEKIFGIRAEDEVASRHDQAMLGNIFHKALQIFYMPSNNEVHPSIVYGIEAYRATPIEKRQRIVDNLIDLAFLAEYQIDDTSTGYNLFVKETLRSIVRKTLEFDLKRPPFKFLCAEYDCSAHEHKAVQVAGINIGGKIDRIDVDLDANGHPCRINVIDYKTSKSSKTENTLSFDNLFKHNDSAIANEWMQVLFYALLLKKRPIAPEYANLPIVPTLYKLDQIQQASGKIQLLTLKMPDNLEITINDFNVIATDYEQKIAELITQITNPENTFAAQEKNASSRCLYCDYKQTCNAPKLTY